MAKSLTRAPLEVLLAMVCLAGCGSRTDLGWFERTSSDAGLIPAPDVFGAFPCSYSPVGRPQPLFFEPFHSVHPRISFGADMLAVSFTVTENTSYPVRIETYLCITETYSDYLCEELILLDSSHLGVSPLAWNGENWGLCWTADEFETIPALFFIDTRAVPEMSSEVGPFNRVCTDLVWAGDHYLAALRESAREDSIEIYQVRDTGSFVEPPLTTITGLEEWMPGGLTAADGIEAVTWTTSHAVFLERLDQPSPRLTIANHPDSFVSFSVSANRAHLVGVFWATLSEEGATLLFSLADVENDVITVPAEVTTSSYWPLGLDIVAVNEGFVLAWIDQGENAGRVYAVAVRFDEWEPRFWTPMDIHEGDVWSVDPSVGGPALAYDDLSVFTVFSIWDETTEHFQVHLQALDCHR